MNRYKPGDYVLYRSKTNDYNFGLITIAVVTIRAKGTNVHYFVAGNGDKRLYENDISAKATLTVEEGDHNPKYVEKERELEDQG